MNDTAAQRQWMVCASVTCALLIWFMTKVEVGEPGSGHMENKVLENTGGICPSICLSI